MFFDLDSKAALEMKEFYELPCSTFAFGEGKPPTGGDRQESDPHGVKKLYKFCLRPQPYHVGFFYAFPNATPPL